jgi:hypothetical protein
MVPALSFATVVVTTSGHLFSCDKFMPMPGTLDRAVARPAPLRSGRARLTHPAPRQWGSLWHDGMDNARGWQSKHA